MQNIPPSRNNRPQAINPPRRTNSYQTSRSNPGQAHQSRQPRPLNVQHSYTQPQSGRRVTKQERIPAVNTLKSGGPRIHKPREFTLPKKKQLSRSERRRRRLQIRDFLFGFTVGLIIFGIAAIFVCQALIGLFA